MPHEINTTMMYAVHDAFRRELDHLARIAKNHQTPRHQLRTATGWELFKRYLHAHHTAEDAKLWPVARHADRSLVDALEAEHATIDGLVEAVDHAIHTPDSTDTADRVDALAHAVRHHLDHEETDGLPLIRATVTQEQWLAFSQRHRENIGEDVPRYLPWVLVDATPQRVALIRDGLPEHITADLDATWQAAFDQLHRWGTK